MYLSYVKTVGMIVILACVLGACGNKHEAYSRGDDLYLDGEKYIEISGSLCLYDESDKKMCKTDDGYTVYEVDGDEKHIYVVRRCLWDAVLFVKESYISDEPSVSAICFGWDKDSYIFDRKIIDCVFALTENEELIDESDELMDARDKGREIYARYGDEVVGRYIGEIFLYQNQYMYYSYNEQIVTVLTDDQIELLEGYL